MRNQARLPLPEDLAQTSNFTQFFEIEEEEKTHGVIFNLTDPAQLSALLSDLTIYAELEQANSPIIQSFNFFFSLAKNIGYLEEIPAFVIEQKLKGIDNGKIATEVNSKFNKTYHINYISTLFHKRGLAKVAEAAYDWYDSVRALAYYNKNAFKQCATCGAVLLRDPRFFMRQSHNSDGFSVRCKRCEAEKRRQKKNNEK